MLVEPLLQVPTWDAAAQLHGRTVFPGGARHEVAQI
jgi:hypothetical protein